MVANYSVRNGDGGFERKSAKNLRRRYFSKKILDSEDRFSYN